MNEPMIDVEAVTVRFRTKTGPFDAVRDASFRVQAGQAFGLVGASGSGKSTLLRALTGLVPVAAGRLSIGAHEVGAQRGSNDRTLRRDVQMVFQDPYGSLHPRFTVDQALREPLAINRLDREDERIAAAL